MGSTYDSTPPAPQGPYAPPPHAYYICPPPAITVNAARPIMTDRASGRTPTSAAAKHVGLPPPPTSGARARRGSSISHGGLPPPGTPGNNIPQLLRQTSAISGGQPRPKLDLGTTNFKKPINPAFLCGYDINDPVTCGHRRGDEEYPCPGMPGRIVGVEVKTLNPNIPEEKWRYDMGTLRRCKLLVDFGSRPDCTGMCGRIHACGIDDFLAERVSGKSGNLIFGLFPNEIWDKDGRFHMPLAIPGGFVKGEIVFSKQLLEANGKTVTKGATGVIMGQGQGWKLEVHFTRGGQAIKLYNVDPNTVSREPIQGVNPNWKDELP